MLEVLISVGLAGMVFVYIEKLYKDHRISNETARKIIHITHGVYVATWPFFVSWRSVIYLEIAFLVMVAFARIFKIFGSHRAVARLSWGEFFYPLGVILLVVTNQPRWVFVLAVLHLALADAFAALVGIRYGKGNRYKVFGQTKSVAGTIAFFVTSVILVSLTFILVPTHINDTIVNVLILLPITTTFIENIGVYGVDNLLIPLAVVLLFGSM